jgi:hypothetical protein
VLYLYVKEQHGSGQLHLHVSPSLIKLSATAVLSAAELKRSGMHINVRKEWIKYKINE